MRLRAIIVDIDGTIADISHRLHFIEKKRPKEKDWDGFYRACVNDEPISDMIDLIETLRLDNYKLIFVTGRSDRVRKETEEWLGRFFDIGHECIVFMRADGDYRADYIIKKEIYERFIRGDFAVDYVFEDRDQVVQMWRKLGLRTLQVTSGGY
jgi:FMN phosphatase YigB (HAD superfamily)